MKAIGDDLKEYVRMSSNLAEACASTSSACEHLATSNDDLIHDNHFLRDENEWFREREGFLEKEIVKLKNYIASIIS